ncbi:2154_t:CDS:2, partial [Cetraspora pellucida]
SLATIPTWIPFSILALHDGLTSLGGNQSKYSVLCLQIPSEAQLRGALGSSGLPKRLRTMVTVSLPACRGVYPIRFSYGTFPEFDSLAHHTTRTHCYNGRSIFHEVIYLSRASSSLVKGVSLSTELFRFNLYKLHLVEWSITTSAFNITSGSL